jgi:hypothetical protein
MAPFRKRNRTCYAKWEDCVHPDGSFNTSFGNERPKPNANYEAAGPRCFARPVRELSPELQPIDFTDGNSYTGRCFRLDHGEGMGTKILM